MPLPISIFFGFVAVAILVSLLVLIYINNKKW